jgi:hypothetical protein
VVEVETLHFNHKFNKSPNKCLVIN